VDLLRPILETATLTPRRARILARVLRNVGDLPGARAAVARGRAALESHPGDRGDLVADDIGLQLEAAQNAEWELDRAAEAVRLAIAAEELARRHGIDAIRAKYVLGEARSLADDLRGLVDLEEALAAALDAGDLTLAFVAADSLVFELLKSGRAEEGYALTQTMQVRANAVGRADAARSMAYWEIQFGWHFGRFPQALAAAEAREALAIPGESGWSLAQLLIDAGRFAEARIRVERIVSDAKPGEYSLGGALWLLAELEFWSGRHRAAAAAADRHAAEVPGAGHRLFIEVVGAWARFELGEPPTWPAMPALRKMTEGAAIELEALRALANGHASAAAKQFEASAEAWTGRHARGELRARWAAGESRRRAGDAKTATAWLLALEERLVAIEARALLARVHRSLRLLGVRRSAAPDAAPGSPLSGREREILALVASGLRDREIAAQLGLSRWAVVRAVESASARLGARTRAEAVALLR
jgi:DNA-binding CsgD family transcriptional regulator